MGTQIGKALDCLISNNTYLLFQSLYAIVTIPSVKPLKFETV